MAGLSAALALQERGASVVLLERRGVLGGRASASLDARTGDEVDSGGHRLPASAEAARDLLRRAGLAEPIPTAPRWGLVHQLLAERFVSLAGSLRRRALVTGCEVEASRVRRVRFIQRAETKAEMQRGKRETQEMLEPDVVVAAVPWHAVGALIPDECRIGTPFAEAGRMAALATVTVHLWIDGAPDVRLGLASPFAVVLDRTGGDRGLRHYVLQTGALTRMPDDANADWIRSAAKALGDAGGPRGDLSHALVLREPFAVTAGVGRLGPQTAIQGFFVSGDWTIGASLDAGIEAAVRSGLEAAAAIGSF